MKKVAFIILLIPGIVANAQNSKRTSAYNSMQDAEFAKAAEQIDEAAKHEKTMSDEKTWRYRGQIYQQIAGSEEDFGIPKDTAVMRALESYKKALELDEKERWVKESRNGFAQSQNLAVNMGIEAYNAKDYPKAKNLFLIGADAARELNVFDTLAVYNGGLAAEQSGDYETAISQYQKAAAVGYQGASMYLYMANLYQKQEMPEKYIETIKEGRDEYPENADLIVYELNYYLRNGEFKEAKNNLQLALKEEPDNKQLHFSLGVVYDNLDTTDAAIESYKKAIEIDSVYFDAVYNLGALYFNQGVEMNNAANDIEDNAKYKAAREEAKEVFKKAKPYLEKAHRLSPDDLGAISSLAQLYAMLEQNEKYTMMKEKLEAAKGGSSEEGTE
jgi:tetratricopeptide (TPR) repeat protein